MGQIAIQASYADFKLLKTRSVYQIILEAPIEKAEDFVTAFGLPIPGQERPVALALLNSSTPSVSPPGKQAAEAAPVEAVIREAPQVEGAGRPTREAPQPTAAPDRLVQYIGIECGNPTFQTWLKNYVDLSGDLDHQRAIHCVHQLLGVTSRAEISTDPIARQKALDLMGAYDLAIGKHAEDRS